MKEENSIFYPPGGILIWIVVLLEVVTFAMGLSMYMMTRQNELAAFSEAQSHLDPIYGMVNTLLLLTSGLLMVTSIHQLQLGNIPRAKKYMVATVLIGMLFLVVKSVEYYAKFQLDKGLLAGTFFMFYWFITGFHFIHVFVAIVLMIAMYWQVCSGYYHAGHYDDVETVGIFWHMCDLIWLLIFPILYLIN